MTWAVERVEQMAGLMVDTWVVVWVPTSVGWTAEHLAASSVASSADLMGQLMVVPSAVLMADPWVAQSVAMSADW